VVGAGEGNRTLVISLEGCCSTIELHPRREQSSDVVDQVMRVSETDLCFSRDGGGGRTRTYEGVSQRIYSLYSAIWPIPCTDTNFLPAVKNPP
jgi:hypothetical protein